MSVKYSIDIDKLIEDFQQGKVTCCGMTIHEIMSLKKENMKLKKENAELEEAVEYWKNEYDYLRANPEEA